MTSKCTASRMITNYRLLLLVKRTIYRVSKKIHPLQFSDIFPQTVGNF